MLRGGAGHLSAVWQFHRHGQCPAGDWQQRRNCASKPLLAQQRFEEALKIYRKQKNEAGEAAALKALGDARVKLQQLDRGSRVLRRGADAIQDGRPAAQRGRNRTRHRAAASCSRETTRARRSSTNWRLIQFHDIEDRRGEADAQLALGEARHLQRQSEEAVRLWQEALTTYRATRDRLGEAQTLGCLGEECLLQRDYAGALTNFEAGVEFVAGDRRSDRRGGNDVRARRPLRWRCSIVATKRCARLSWLQTARSPRQFGWLGWRAVTAGNSKMRWFTSPR